MFINALSKQNMVAAKNIYYKYLRPNLLIDLVFQQQRKE